MEDEGNALADLREELSHLEGKVKKQGVTLVKITNMLDAMLDKLGIQYEDPDEAV